MVEEGVDMFEKECVVLSILFDDGVGLFLVGDDVGDLVGLVVIPEEVLFSKGFHIHFIFQFGIDLLSFFAF